MQPFAILDAVQWLVAGASHALFEVFRAFSQAAAPVAATAFWQGLIVAAGLAVSLRLAPRMPAAQRFSVWTAGFAALVVLPFVPLLSHFTATAASGASAVLSEGSTKPWLQLDMRWSLAIAALWLAASVFRAVDLAIHSYRLRRLWKTATPIAPSISVPLSPTGRGRMRSRGAVQVYSTRKLDRPSLIGFFAPRILIPEWLLARLTPEELRQVVLHETEHLRRGDDWTNLLQKLCLVLFPLNPSLWWIERRLCQEREMACDDGVVRVTRAPRAYAACLANLAERGLQHRAEALSLGAWQRRPQLVQRVHRILRHKHALSPLATRSLLGVLGCGLLFGSVQLARCPQLVAFVPARNAENARARATIASQAAPARLLNAAYAPPRRTNSAAHRRHAALTKAAIARAAQERGAAKPYVARAWKASSAQLASNFPQQMLQTLFPASPAPAADEQQWIVLTAWEQVQTTRRVPRQTADYDTGVSADQTAAHAAPHTNGRVTDQITVTRLILQVLPAGSISAQPVSVPVRSGWLVIQL